MQNNRKIIYLAGFLFSLPIALATYINSSFISSFVGEGFTSVVYILGSFGSILALFIAPVIFRKMGGYKFLLLMIAIDAISFLTLAMAENKFVVISMFILGFSMNTLIFFSLDEILKIFSLDSATGRIRGTYIAISSSAWIIAQLASGTILGEFSFRIVYFTGFLVMILFLLLLFFRLKNIPDPNYDKVKFLKYIKEFMRNKNLLRAYSLNFLLQFFFCWMVIYTPIYLHTHLGISWSQIGLIFAVMLLPFSLIPFPLGKYSDKVGERRLLMLGFAISALSTLFLFFIRGNEIWIWALMLFSTRVGASTIEAMSDTYFFKHIKSENEELVGIYRTATPLAYILGPIIASIFFIFIPSFNFLYLILGAIMLYGIYLSSTIKKSDI